MNTTELRQRYVEGIYETRSLLIREEPFDLKSGRTSHVYLNHNNFLVQSRYLAVVAELYASRIAALRPLCTLGVVDSIMSPIIAGAISVRHHSDIVVIKSHTMSHGVKDDIFGDPSGEVVLIDDMTSSGGTIREAALKVREYGGKISLAVVSASRDERAKDALRQHGIELVSLFTFDDIFELLEPRLSPRERALIVIERAGRG